MTWNQMNQKEKAELLALAAVNARATLTRYGCDEEGVLILCYGRNVEDLASVSNLKDIDQDTRRQRMVAALTSLLSRIRQRDPLLN